jgi:hypothetical protein
MKEPYGDRNKREVIRTDNPFKGISPPVVAVNMPGLTDHPLAPEDFNETGFRAHLPVPGEVGAVYPCVIHFRDVAVEGFFARVVWLKEIVGLPPSWEAGFNLEIPDLERSELAEMLRAGLEKDEARP